MSDRSLLSNGTWISWLPNRERDWASEVIERALAPLTKILVYFL